jgi:hypothetical protein
MYICGPIQKVSGVEKQSKGVHMVVLLLLLLETRWRVRSCCWVGLWVGLFVLVLVAVKWRKYVMCKSQRGLIEGRNGPIGWERWEMQR